MQIAAQPLIRTREPKLLVTISTLRDLPPGPILDSDVALHPQCQNNVVGTSPKMRRFTCGISYIQAGVRKRSWYLSHFSARHEQSHALTTTTKTRRRFKSESQVRQLDRGASMVCYHSIHWNNCLSSTLLRAQECSAPTTALLGRGETAVPPSEPFMHYSTSPLHTLMQLPEARHPPPAGEIREVV